MFAKPTFSDWEAVADRLELQRVGRELSGPCPLCGGHDRFHIRKENAGAVVGCRGCIDGQPQGRARFGELVHLVFGDRFLPKSPKSRQRLQNGSVSHPREYTSQPARALEQTKSQRRAAEFGRRLWSEAGRIPTPSRTGPSDTSPPRLWFAARSLLHPWQTPPPAIRYHTSEQLIVTGLWSLDAIRTAWPRLPTDPPPAVHCIAIDEEGRKRYPPRWTDERGHQHDKRTYGQITDTGAGLALGDPEAVADPVHICEGVADALAIYSRRPGLVLASITTVTAVISRLGVFRRIYDSRRAYIWSDIDANQQGQDAGAQLAEALKAVGLTTATATGGEGQDPAQWSAELGWPVLDPDQFAESAGKFLDDGQPLAEADRIAIYTLTTTQGDQH